MHVMIGVVQQLTHNRAATKSVAWYVIYSTVFATFDWQSITSITRDDSAIIYGSVTKRTGCTGKEVKLKNVKINSRFTIKLLCCYHYVILNINWFEFKNI